MSDDLISRKALFNELFVRNGKVCPNNDIDNFPINFNVKDIKQAIRNAPTAYDVEKVVEGFEKERNFLFDKNGHCYSAREKITIDKAIEIIKSGGIAND